MYQYPPPPRDPSDQSETSQVAELSRRTLRSEQVILDAPMSFTGMTKRTMRYHRNHPVTSWWAKALATTGITLWLTLSWIVILAWYAVFGVGLVPYRLIRRGQRRDEQQRRQHAELLAGQQQKGWR